MVAKVFAALTITACLALAGAAVMGAFSLGDGANPTSQEVTPTQSSQDINPSCPYSRKCSSAAAPSCCEE
jgi:hypothetical protein